MRASAWLGDARSLRDEARRLKDASSSIGAERLLAECAALEKCASDGSLDELVGLEERIEHAFSVLEQTCEGIRRRSLFQKALACCNMGPAA